MSIIYKIINKINLLENLDIKNKELKDIKFDNLNILYKCLKINLKQDSFNSKYFLLNKKINRKVIELSLFNIEGKLTKEEILNILNQLDKKYIYTFNNINSNIHPSYIDLYLENRYKKNYIEFINVNLACTNKKLKELFFKAFEDTSYFTNEEISLLYIILSKISFCSSEKKYIIFKKNKKIKNLLFKLEIFLINKKNINIDTIKLFYLD